MNDIAEEMVNAARGHFVAAIIDAYELGCKAVAEENATPATLTGLPLEPPPEAKPDHSGFHGVWVVGTRAEDSEDLFNEGGRPIALFCYSGQADSWARANYKGRYYIARLGLQP